MFLNGYHENFHVIHDFFVMYYFFQNNFQTVSTIIDH